MTEPAESSNGSESKPERALPVVYHPTVKPAAIWLGITLVVGLVVVGTLLGSPDLLGDPELTQIVTWVVAIVLLLVVLRLVVTMYVLRRTAYRITRSSLHREYELFYRHWEREVPLRQIRGLELSRTRIQTLLGYGDLVFLTGGTNQSLGFIRFDNVGNADRIKAIVHGLVAED